MFAAQASSAVPRDQSSTVPEQAWYSAVNDLESWLEFAANSEGLTFIQPLGRNLR